MKKVDPKPSPLQVLNEEFEEDLRVGGLLRQYRSLGRQLISVGIELKKAGHSFPEVKLKDIQLSILDLSDDEKSTENV
jgi:hypothetical protein